MVAEAAPGGDVVQRKVPAAQGDPAGFQHMQAASPGVLRVVLIVAVHSDDAQTLGPVVEEIPEGVFQGRTFALVDFMMEQGDLRMQGGKIGEIVQVFGLAAVVDQNNIGKAIFQ